MGMAVRVLKHRIYSLLFLMVVSVSSVCQAGNSLTFGVYASDNASAMYEAFGPVIQALSVEMTRQTGVDTRISLRVFKSYQEGLERLTQGKVDFMRMGPASYILAKHDNPGVKLLAMEVRKAKKRFKGVIIVPSDSEISSLEELKGKRFAFGNRNSTIGRYLVQAELVDAGIYANDLRSYDYLDRHDLVASAVGHKRYDAGSVKEKTFNKHAAKHNIKALAYFDNVTKPWVARSGMDEVTFSALRNALLAIEDKAALAVLKVDRFDSAEDSEYDFVRQGMLKSRDFDRKP